MIIYYTFALFFFGFVSGMFFSMWYLKEGKYIGQIVGLSNTCVYVDNR